MRNYARLPDGSYSREDCEELVSATLADLSMEGMVCTEHEKALLMRYASGELTQAEYMAEVMKSLQKGCGSDV